MSRPGFGSCGRQVSFLMNHLKVSIEAQYVIFYQYSVKITSGDGLAIKSEGVGREVIHKLRQTYPLEFSGTNFIYDGDRILYTVGALLGSTFEFTVVLEKAFAKSFKVMEPTKRTKHASSTKVFKVELIYSRKVPLMSMNVVSRGSEAEGTQDVLRILNTIICHQAADRGCLLVRQSFFSDDSRNFMDVGGSVNGARSLHSSFHATQAGLSLNMDVATTLVIKPGSVLDFLRANQNVQDDHEIDWEQIFLEKKGW